MTAGLPSFPSSTYTVYLLLTRTYSYTNLGKTVQYFRILKSTVSKRNVPLCCWNTSSSQHRGQDVCRNVQRNLHSWKIHQAWPVPADNATAKFWETEWHIVKKELCPLKSTWMVGRQADLSAVLKMNPSQGSTLNRWREGCVWNANR